MLTMNKTRRRISPKWSLLTYMRGLSIILVFVVLSVSAFLIGLVADREFNKAFVDIDKQILNRICKDIALAEEEVRKFSYNLAQSPDFLDQIDRFQRVLTGSPYTYEAKKQGEEFSNYLATQKIAYDGIREMFVQIGNARVSNYNSSIMYTAERSASKMWKRWQEMAEQSNGFFSYTVHSEDEIGDEVIRYLEGLADWQAVSQSLRDEYENTEILCHIPEGTDDVWLLMHMKRDWLGYNANLDESIVVTDLEGRELFAENETYLDIFQKACLNEPGTRQCKGEAGRLRVSSIIQGQYNVGIFTDNETVWNALWMIWSISALLVFVLTLIMIRIFSAPLKKIIHHYTEFVNAVNRYPAGSRREISEISMQKRSLRQYMSLYFTLLLCSSALLCSFLLVFVSQGYMRTVIAERNEQYLNKQAQALDTLALKNEKTAYSMVFNDEIQHVLDKSNYNINIPEGYIYLFEDQCEINVYDLDGKLLYYTSYIKSSDYLRENGVVQERWDFFSKDRLGHPVISNVTQLTRYRVGNYSLAPAGFLEIIYPMSYLESLIKEIDSSGMNCAITDHEGRIVVSSRDEEIGMNMQEVFKDIQTVKVEARLIPLTLVATENMVWISDLWKSFLAAFLMAMAFVFTLCIILSALVSWGISREVRRLVDCLTCIGIKAPEHSWNVHPITEVENLYNVFEGMAKRIDRLIEDEYKSKIKEIQLKNERNESDLAALQAQINPHFLFNMLECIRWMVQDGDISRCEEAISLLGRLLRYSTKINQPVVSMEEELNMAMTYVRIQKLRLQCAPEVLIHADPEVRFSRTLRMVLQPLLENAFAYGTQPQGDGVILVTAQRHGDEVRLCVEDNGQGMEEDTLVRIREQLKNGTAKGAEHVGLANVHNRLRIYFGKQYGLEVENLLDGGVRVTIRQPFDKDQ